MADLEKEGNAQGAGAVCPWCRRRNQSVEVEVTSPEKKDEPVKDTMEAKPYTSHLLVVTRATPLRLSDLDTRSLLLFDIIHQKGDSEEACQYLLHALSGLSRKDVANWRGYVYTLIRAWDLDAHQKLKEKTVGKQSDSPKTGVPTNRSSKGRRKGPPKEKRTIIGEFAFNKNAPEFVPGKGSEVLNAVLAELG
eukprot:TRINITY_DN76369_c0_g1_i1.p1 TRINITY_DN76369_c0_g1~~TRINITY_DN76369_c0_g1_i1.p1  ORF type:complete len:193 (-),score=39.60 TRINITY_DN76369_c0_g1_i1:88-666(-)